MPIAKYRYLPSRPIKFADMNDTRWWYTEAPPAMAENMAGLPTSRHEFGVIGTDRMLLESVREKAGLTPYAE
jgi:hypothetical protein